MTFVVLVVGGFVVNAPAQGDPTDADLIRASNGRVVSVGNLDTGRSAAIPLEQYVARVLAGEGEPRAGDAAQQALAVAIRTFALANSGRHRREGFDLCDSTHCQVLRTATAVTRRAALATAGRILTYEGHPAEVFYSASCGGRSEAASDLWPGSNYPYLRSVADDVHEQDAEWTVELTLKEVEGALRRAGFSGTRLARVEVDARSGSGRAARLRVSGMQPAVIGGDQFRAAVGAAVLRSTAFSITPEGSRVRFVGRGYGHGVGLCVIGAGRRAMRGESFREILALYYPGLSLGAIDPILTRTTRPGAPAAVPPAPAAARPSVVAPAAPTVIASRAGGIVVHSRAPATTAAEVQQLAARAHAELSQALGTSVSPLTIELHDTLDDFRLATGEPWWVVAVARGTTIDLAPLPVLAQADGLERAVRMAVAELLVSRSLAARPAWVRIGAARYFAAPRAAGATPAPARLRCPSDAELTLSISAAAQREAEQRAEACFARAYEKNKDWRSVR